MSFADADVRAAVGRVVDPCSDALGVPLDLAEMGLIESVEVDRDAGTAHVALVTTAPCCAYGPRMARALEEELRALPWVRDCRVELRHELVWTPDRMTPDAHLRLGARRDRVRGALDVRPYDWEVPREH